MTKIKISLFALAFVIAAGAATAVNADPVPGRWYAPDYEESQIPLDNPPTECVGGIELCATSYFSNGQVDQTVFFD